jgi:DNA-binding response OmpR family regulator
MAQQATVLILADVGDAERAALEAACSAAGFVPSVEPSAEAAIGKLTAKKYDALVVHLGTPGAALACMRARGKLLRTRIPVVALVDTEDEATFSRAYRAGADEVLLLERPEWLTARLRGLPRSAIPQPNVARGDAVVADADRTRAEVIERVLRDAGFRVEVAVDGFSTRLQAGRPSLKVAVVDASLDDLPSLIVQAKSKGARCAWVVRARPEQLDEFRQKLAKVERVAVLSAYGPPDDVLFEVNRLIEPRPSDGRGEGRLLQGGILRFRWGEGGAEDIGYLYNVSATGIFVRTLAAPPAEKVAVEMAVPGGDDRLKLKCDVVWRREFGATRKEPVPAGLALKITGGDLGAWTRICPPTSSAPPPAEKVQPPKEKVERLARAESPAAPAALVAAPQDVDIRPREQQSSVEEMLASVLSESTAPAEDEAAGAAPLSIDGGTVVELHSGARAAEAVADDLPTVVRNTLLEKPPPAEGAYTAEKARQELLAEALDASKTPLAIARTVPPRAEPRAGPALPRVSEVPRPSPSLSPPRREPKADSSAQGTPAKVDAGGFFPETPRKSDRPPAESIDVSDITPASIGFDLSEDGRIIEAVRSVPPVVERPDAATRVDKRPIDPPKRGGTLAGTGRPPPPSAADPLPKPRLERVAPTTETEPIELAALAKPREHERATAALAKTMLAPGPAPKEKERAPDPGAPPASSKRQPAPSPKTEPEVPPMKSVEPSTRVVADPDALPTGDTVRPSAVGLAEDGTDAPAAPPIAPVRVPNFDGLRPASSPSASRSQIPEDDFSVPPKRSSAVKWMIGAAIVLGGAAAFVVSPTLRTHAAGEATASTPPAPVATPPSAPATATGLEKVSEAVPAPEAPGQAPSAVPAPSATTPPTATPPPAVASAETTPAPATTGASGSEIDSAALAALQPGQGYLYVASPLATNVYIYGILAGTTNQRITSKCGPRFIRLGSAPGIWQGEGQVHIVKCGALTRMEMGH